jgi:hypothetical protein
MNVKLRARTYRSTLSRSLLALERGKRLAIMKHLLKDATGKRILLSSFGWRRLA